MKNNKDQNLYSKLTKAKNDLIIERKAFIKQKKIVNNENSILSFQKLVLEALQNNKWCKYPIPKKIGKITPKNSIVYIISDEHYKGERDNLSLKKIYTIIQEDIVRNDFKSVELWYLGDGVDGLLHIGSLASNDGAIIPMLNYCNITIDCINQIKQIKSVKIVIKSNHTQTRALGTSRNELAREDLGYVIAELFKNRLRGNITLLANDIVNFKHNNKDIVLLHGHQPYAKSKAKMLEYWSSTHKTLPDLIFMGHYHNFKVNSYGENKYLCVAPTAKSFNGDFETENGYISSGEIIRFDWHGNKPSWKLISIKKEKNKNESTNKKR